MFVASSSVSIVDVPVCNSDGSSCSVVGGSNLAAGSDDDSVVGPGSFAVGAGRLVASASVEVAVLEEDLSCMVGKIDDADSCLGSFLLLFLFGL